jgi:predicted kinase
MSGVQKQQLVMIRGLPDSGKSTLASCIGRAFNGVTVEEDQYMVGQDGKYAFDAARLEGCRAMCLARARVILSRGGTAIVSNIFASQEEAEPYFELAREMKVPVAVYHCQSHFEDESTHNVPDAVVQRMRLRWVDKLKESSCFCGKAGCCHS